MQILPNHGTVLNRISPPPHWVHWWWSTLCHHDTEPSPPHHDWRGETLYHSRMISTKDHTVPVAPTNTLLREYGIIELFIKDVSHILTLFNWPIYPFTSSLFASFPLSQVRFNAVSTLVIKFLTESSIGTKNPNKHNIHIVIQETWLDSTIHWDCKRNRARWTSWIR